MDRRIKKTRQAITNATVELLTSVTINKITIKEICNKANISRSTFYLHFYDTCDVIEQLYNDISINIAKMLDKFDFTTILSNPKPFLMQISDFVKENARLYQMLMVNDYHSNFRRRLKKILEDKVLQENAYRFRNRAELQYCIGYTMSGLVETICDNMEDLSNENSEKLIDTLTRLICSGFNVN